jgi:uncharacterized protein (TIGR01777 family)
LEQLERPVVLSRRAQGPADLSGKATFLRWDAEREPAPRAGFDGVDTVFHLAGEPVAEGRWTQEKKRRIRDSRVIGTRNLVDGIAQCEQRPKTLVSASAVGYYGSRGDEILTEDSAVGNDFLADVCAQWEREALRARELGIRVVCLRIGIVLGRDGGALKKMLPIFRLGLGGRLGNGQQWMPWVHLDDIVGLLLHGAKSEGLAGPINGVSPQPVTNREFTKVLAGALHRPAIFPVPVLALKVALGETAEIVLASQRVIPQVAQASQYTFRHSDLATALATCV